MLQVGEEFVLTIRNPAVIKGKKGLGVSYEAFVDDVQVSYHHVSRAAKNWTCMCSYEACGNEL